MFLKNENGRSMVEMLGVLAIIGVLSVAGIIGYTMAMRKYRANEITEAISILAIAAKTANGGSGITMKTGGNDYTDLFETSNLPSGASSLTVNPDEDVDGRYVINLTTDTPELCNVIANTLGTSSTNPLFVKANGCSSKLLTITAK